MEKQDPRFSGGGTPISSLVQGPPQGQPQGPPQRQPPQGLQPQGLQPQGLQPQGQPPHQVMYHQGPPQQGIPQKGMYQSMKVKENFSEKFENVVGCSWQRFLSLVLLVVIFNNSFVYDFEKSLIPIGMRFGDPPLLAVFLNAIIIGIIFMIISKFT